MYSDDINMNDVMEWGNIFVLFVVFLCAYFVDFWLGKMRWKMDGMMHMVKKYNILFIILFWNFVKQKCIW